MCEIYYGKITSDEYEAALQIRGDDGTCWDEMVPLADPPLTLGPSFPEELSGDDVIAIWEAAHAEATLKYGEDNYVFESVTLFLKELANAHEGEIVWQSNVRKCD